MILEIIGLLVLLLLSGFFSSSEIAFVVASKLKIELRARKNNLSAKIISYFSYAGDDTRFSAYRQRAHIAGFTSISPVIGL